MCVCGRGLDAGTTSERGRPTFVGKAHCESCCVHTHINTQPPLISDPYFSHLQPIRNDERVCNVIGPHAGLIYTFQGVLYGNDFLFPSPWRCG